MGEILPVLWDYTLPEDTSAVLRRIIPQLETAAALPETLVWDLNRLRHSLMRETGIETADWDFLDPESGRLDSSARRVLSCRVYIDGIRSPYNLGSIFRTAECFGVQEILIAPGSASPEHRRAARSAMGSINIVPWRYAEFESLPEDQGIFALELGGTPIGDFAFPRNGICIVGSEELGIRPDLRRIAEKNSGIVSIPLLGAKGSLNVSVAFGILMQTWSGALTRGS
jgi:TrmH family RNA methyltransferase